MAGCECKTGFFALRDCQEPVFNRCKACRRAMCRRHGAVADANGRCLDCAARDDDFDPDAGINQRDSRNSRDSSRNASDDDTALDDRWVYAYRHQYYSRGYVPIYAGTHHSSYYDRYDARSFENIEVERDDFDDDAGAGFGDS